MRTGAVVVAGVALLVAGCGSGHRPVPPLSQKSFAAAANRICAQATTRRGRLAGLRTLRPPSSAADLYGHWLAAERDALVATRTRATPSAKSELDPAVVLAITEGKISGYARRLGAVTCAMRTIGTMPQ
jgi:hypothetical protein